jgi:NAD(P)-dependent dehydrogenase (short-subunit alcohol dehydrogenase family)
MAALAGRVAVVAGATRGAGRGIARMLGEAGATVYCTGRSMPGAHSPDRPHKRRPETVDQTARLVDEAGGRGIALRVDHRDEAEVEALFARVIEEQGRLDLLVNVLGGPEVRDRMAPFWKLDVGDGRRLVDAWVWPHVTTCRHAATHMVKARRGLIVEVIEQDTLGYHGHFYWDLAMTSLKRLAYAMAEELGAHGVSALAVAPGFMRTEAILDHFGATPETWREVARTNREAMGFGFAGSESPCFVGRGVAALAADPAVRSKSGGVYGSWTLSEEYGFADVDGARPHWGRYFEQNFAGMFGKPNASLTWKVSGA